MLIHLILILVELPQANFWHSKCQVSYPYSVSYFTYPTILSYAVKSFPWQICFFGGRLLTSCQSVSWRTTSLRFSAALSSIAGGHPSILSQNTHHALITRDQNINMETSHAESIKKSDFLVPKTTDSDRVLEKTNKLRGL
jgi:hypothetical protein